MSSGLTACPIVFKSPRLQSGFYTKRNTLHYELSRAWRLRGIQTARRLSDERGPSQSSHTQSLEETKDISVLDNLISIIRERSHPSTRSTMPMGAPLLWSETVFSERPLLSAPVPVLEVMPTRRMMDSYSELILPFESQRELLDQYINASGGLRTGKLMENLDSLAGSIGYKHVLGPGVQALGSTEESGFFVVTAAVDRLDMLLPLQRHNVRDLRLCGHVIHTGRSSMEIVVKMELLGEKKEAVLIGRFSMVCRDTFTHKARPIPKLELGTPEELALFNMGAAHKERHKLMAMRSLKLVPPSTEEAAQLHQLYLNYGQMVKRDTHTERIWMEETVLENCILMFPQERNVHGNIFGGYLMRLAYELGATTAMLFSRRPMRFLSLDGLSFSHPVHIGSILRLRSKVGWTGVGDRYPALVHTTVQASVVEVTTGKELATNDFRFTWCDDNDPPLARRVVPRTYQDAMEWLEARRAVEMGDEIRMLRK